MACAEAKRRGLISTLLPFPKSSTHEDVTQQCTNSERRATWWKIDRPSCRRRRGSSDAVLADRQYPRADRASRHRRCCREVRRADDRETWVQRPATGSKGGTGRRVVDTTFFHWTATCAPMAPALLQSTTTLDPGASCMPIDGPRSHHLSPPFLHRSHPRPSCLRPL